MKFTPNPGRLCAVVALRITASLFPFVGIGLLLTFLLARNTDFGVMILGYPMFCLIVLLLLATPLLLPILLYRALPMLYSHLNTPLEISEDQLTYGGGTSTTSIPLTRIDAERSRISASKAVLKYRTSHDEQGTLTIPLYLFDPEAHEAITEIIPNHRRNGGDR